MGKSPQEKVSPLALRTKRNEIRKNDVQSGGIVFYDAVVLLGTPYVNQTEKEVRLVGYRVANVMNP